MLAARKLRSAVGREESGDQTLPDKVLRGRLLAKDEFADLADQRPRPARGLIVDSEGGYFAVESYDPLFGGQVYFIRAADDCKIGVALSPEIRLHDLQTAHARLKLQIEATIPGNCGLEKLLHAHFRSLRLKGEWFEYRDELAAFVGDCKEASTAHERIVARARSDARKTKSALRNFMRSAEVWQPFRKVLVSWSVPFDYDLEPTEQGEFSRRPKAARADQLLRTRGQIAQALQISERTLFDMRSAGRRLNCHMPVFRTTDNGPLLAWRSELLEWRDELTRLLALPAV